MQFFNRLNPGVRYMLIASFLFALMGAFAKLLSSSMPPVEVVFFRNVIGVILIVASLAKVPFSHKGGKPFLLIFRGVIGFLSLLAFFYNIAHISLADAMTFSRTSPIFTALFAAWFLKESIGKKGWIAVFIGFIGVVFIMQPSGITLSKTDILGLFSGVGAALAYTSVRELKKYYDTRAIVLSFMGAGTAGPILLMGISYFVPTGDLDFILGKFVMPKSSEWLYILGLGIFSTLAQTYMTKAYGATRAGIAGAVSYTNILFSLFFGIMLGDSFPNVAGLFGIMLVVMGGILVAKEKV
ncbi:MAG: DMT family transporter [Campylobacterales bacterium]|nr:DMT family transporter [Campylobacterales bacterium]